MYSPWKLLSPDFVPRPIPGTEGSLCLKQEVPSSTELCLLAVIQSN